MTPKQQTTTGLTLGLAVAAALWTQQAAAGCAAAEDACEIAEGTYHLVLPDTAPEGNTPALVFLHGWGASGEGMLRMRGMVQSALDRGYAVITPDGIPREGRNGRGWGFHPERPGPRDEVAFLQAVRDDAIARHGIDPDRVLLGGFSIGGSMTSYLACAAPDAFAAYVPVAGAFWYPHPTGCAGPVNLLHTHGWTDGTVPLEGRILRGATSLEEPGVFAQADIWQAMQIWRRTNECRPNATSHGEHGIFWTSAWENCGSGHSLGFALFNGGHGVPEGWTDMALDWFEAL